MPGKALSTVFVAVAAVWLGNFEGFVSKRLKTRFVKALASERCGRKSLILAASATYLNSFIK